MAENKLFEGKGTLQVTAMDFMQLMQNFKNQYDTILENQEKIISLLENKKDIVEDEIKIESIKKDSKINILDGFFDIIASDLSKTMGKNEK